MAKGANTTIGYLNALVITQIYDDGTAPAAPKSLTGQQVPAQGVKLNWQDVAYNETAYEVYRSASENGTYTKVGTTAANASSYTDSSIAGNSSYYYKVRSINSYGVSAYSNIALVTTANRIPQLAAIADVIVKNNQTWL
ncbi:MAG: fibronectin type III domain-containing protein [Chitinophagaceae bacterium]